MEIRFIGPLGVVTGSCTWMRDTRQGWNFLIDCGMQQGERGADAWNRADWPFDPADIRFVVLTHAHMDHCGLLPMLYRDGFRGNVICPVETRDLAILLLNDAARLPGALHSEQDVARIRWHQPRATPLLGGSFHPVDQDLFLRFFRTGHVVGAISVAVHWGPKGPEQRSIVFSGDLGPASEDDEQLPFLRFRMHPQPCDYAVIESTYGATVRDPEANSMAARHAALCALLDRTLAEGGALVLPAFALGRTQDILFDLHWIVASEPERYQGLHFLVDAPGAQRMHAPMLEAFGRTETNGGGGKVRPLWLGKQMARWLALDDKDPVHVARLLDIIAMTLGLERAPTAPATPGNEIARNWRPLMQPVRQRRQMLEQGLPGPCVLVTGSGTCDGGPAAAWLPRLLGAATTTVALTGHCTPGSVGGQLFALRDTPPSQRMRHQGSIDWPDGASMPIAAMHASITRIAGYSAHADQAGLLDWLFWNFRDNWRATAGTVFVQHGEDGARAALQAAIGGRAGALGMDVNAIAPDCASTWFDLDAGGAAIQADARRAEIERQMQELQRALGELARPTPAAGRPPERPSPAAR